jgi:uncharacterized membrane protein
MKMKISEWASGAEIVGGFSLMISLIYVGIQVNDNATALRP